MKKALYILPVFLIAACGPSKTSIGDYNDFLVDSHEALVDADDLYFQAMEEVMFGEPDLDLIDARRERIGWVADSIEQVLSTSSMEDYNGAQKSLVSICETYKEYSSNQYKQIQDLFLEAIDSIMISESETAGDALLNEVESIAAICDERSTSLHNDLDTELRRVADKYGLWIMPELNTGDWETDDF